RRLLLRTILCFIYPLRCCAPRCVTSFPTRRSSDLKEYGPSKTLYNRWKRWGDKGIFIQMMEGMAVPEAPELKTIMIDATYLKAHRTASSLRVKKGVQAA